MKKLLCLALAAMLCLALAACAVAEGTWKIAILTGTTSQGEEEFRAAERAQKADPEHIITDTYRITSWPRLKRPFPSSSRSLPIRT